MKYIYCDESCHLEHDNAKAMLLGAITCPAEEKKRICAEIRAIKNVMGSPPGVKSNGPVYLLLKRPSILI